MGKAYSGRRPEDQPVFTRPTMLDFEKRRLFLARMSGSPTPHPTLTPSIASTYTVAASDAPAAWKARADTLCNGTNDHLNIQGALDAGFDVLLSPGTFNIEVSLTMDSYNMLRGCGKGTILTTTTADVDIITATGGDGTEKVGLIIRDLCIDGDAGSAANDSGIIWTYVDDSKIIDCWVQDNGEYGVKFLTCDDCTIRGVHSENNTVRSVILDTCNRIKVLGCEINGDSGYVFEGDTCDKLEIANSTFNATVGADCMYIYLCTNGDIANNVINFVGGFGIDVLSSTDMTLQGNTVDGGGAGTTCILVDSYSDRALVVNNTAIGALRYGIELGSAEYCIVGLNNVHDNGRDGILANGSDHATIVVNRSYQNSQATDDTYSDITVYADYCSVQSNTCRAGGETNKPKYGILVSGDYNKILNNDLYDDGFGTGPYSISGTGNAFMPATGVGISDDQIVQVDGSPADDEYARWTANGLEGRSYAEVRDDLSVYTEAEVDAAIDADIATHAADSDAHHAQAHKDTHDPEDGGDPLDCAAALEIASVQAAAEGSEHYFARSDHVHQVSHGITDNHIVTVDGSPEDDDYAKFTANGLEGRSYSEVRTDLEVPDTTLAAVTYYVDAGSGSDVTGTGASGSPFATIQHALDQLPVVIAHDCTIKVRGQQNYAESNVALDFSRFSTLATITLSAVNSSDEDMFDNGQADAGAGNDELDDATKSWSTDQFSGAYVWIYEGTGAGQIRLISGNTSTKLNLTAAWTANPDGTSYYAIGGGATLTGSDDYHMTIDKKVNVNGFRHTNSSRDINFEAGAVSTIQYNVASSADSRFIAQVSLCDTRVYYNFVEAGYDYGAVIAESSCWWRANVVDSATVGFYLLRVAFSPMTGSAGWKNFFLDCTTGVKVNDGSGCLALSSQVFSGCTADKDPAVSGTIPEWWN